MGYDPANDARLRREEQRRQEQFRENNRTARETQQANERRRNAEFYKALRDAPNTYRIPATPDYLNTAQRNPGSRSLGDGLTGGTRTAGPLDSLWRLVSIVGGFAGGVLVWRAVYTANPASPWISLAAGATAGWATAKVIDSELVRGLVKFSFYAAIVAGVLWVITHNGK